MVSPEWTACRVQICVLQSRGGCTNSSGGLETLRWAQKVACSWSLTCQGSVNFIPISAGSRSYGFAVQRRSLCQREFKSSSLSGIRTAPNLKLLIQCFKISHYVGVHAWLEHGGTILSQWSTAVVNYHLKWMKWLYNLSLPCLSLWTLFF